MRPVDEAILAAAGSELGVHEIPPGSNNGTRVNDFQSKTWLPVPRPGTQGWPWCVAFAWGWVVWFIVLRQGNPFPTASVSQAAKWFRDNGWAIPRKNVHPGCICCLGNGRHMTIFHHKVGERQFVGRGGNQSDKVTDSLYSLSDITTAAEVPDDLFEGKAEPPKPKKRKPLYEVVRGEGSKTRIVFTNQRADKATAFAKKLLNKGAKKVTIRKRRQDA